MRKKLLKLGALAAFAFVGNLVANEYRSPWISEMGPIRYRMEKLDKSKWSLDTWSSCFYKGSDKAFIKHGTKVKPLTELYFSKSDFYISDALGTEVANNSVMYENTNPYIFATRIHPRVSYTEYGCTLGARWEMPVWKQKGRFGIRANVPFRDVKLERDNDAEQAASADEVAVIKGTVRVAKTVRTAEAPADHEGNPESYIDSVKIEATGYKGSLLRNLPMFIDGTFKAALRVQSPLGPLMVNDKNIYVGEDQYLYANNHNASDDAPLAFTYSKKLPYHKLGAIKINSNPIASQSDPNDVEVWQQIEYTAGACDYSYNIVDDYHTQALGSPLDPSDGRVWKNIKVLEAQVHPINFEENSTSNVPAAVTVLPTTGIGLHEETVYLPIRGSAPLVDPVNMYNEFPEQAWRTIWLSTVHNSDGSMTDNSEKMKNTIENALLPFEENIEEWLSKRGYDFRTSERIGLGDIDLEMFYEHTFSNKWVGELALGVRMPSSGSLKYDGNPYRAPLGNGNHWEIMVGGLLAWQPLTWMNVKLDLKGHFALEATEHKAASFKGALIKNVGPEASADVDWQSLVGRLDFNFFHPKNKELCSTLGYELYYKTKDHIKFKHHKMEGFLGKLWNTSTNLYDADGSSELSDSVAEKKTEAIGHKVRCELSYKLSKWVELYGSGSYVFAGQNIPRETDCQGGVLVKF